jgi:flagellar hook protein FlgE
MSINESMWIGVSGLMAHGDAMSIVGDNISNASTVGFKRERASFEDVLGGQLTNQRMGGGVFLGNAQTMFEQGGIQQTGNPLDMALQGHGMFVVSGTNDGVTGQFFSRNGQFQMDNTGKIVNQQGLALQGYAIDPATGTRSNTIGDLDIGARTSPPVATTTAQATMQLDSTQPDADPAIPFDPANPKSYTYATSEQVYDSLGNSHSVNMYYRKDAAGSWSYHATVDGSDVGGTAGVQTEIGSGTLTFDTNGVLTAQTPTAGTANFVGATPQSINFTFDGSTQTANPSSTTSTNITGRPAGTITDMIIDSDGTITGKFSNGDSAKLAQVAVATFANEDGLQRDGNNLMTATTASGQALVDGASVGGRAAISQGALEESNVDLSTELVTMISYQRAFEANSKTVTTADEMMTDVVNLVR